MTATALQPSEGAPHPPGLAVSVAEAELAGAWAAICPLQPVARDGAGAIVCAPRCAPEGAAAALAGLPFPVVALATVPGWPDPPAAMVGGWYRRSPDHLAAPCGVRELVQVAGEAFGGADHATTAMCLEALDDLSPGPALDAGCGAGLLAQAWVALGRGPVLAIDLDPRAIAQAAASLAAAGREGQVTLRRGPLEALSPEQIAGRVVLANVPTAAHAALLAGAGDTTPAAVVLSGIRPPEAPALANAWVARGLRRDGAWERGGFACLRLVA